MAEDATSVGAIKGTLELDDAGWNAQLDAAEAKAHELGASNPTIRVNVDDAEAIADLAAVQAAVDATGGSSAGPTVSGDGTRDAALAQASLAASSGDLDGAFDALNVALDAYVAELPVAEANVAELAAEQEALAASIAAGTAAFTRQTAAEVENTEATEAQNVANDGSIQQWQLIAAAIGALVPLAAPLTGFIVGVGGGLAGMGAAGVLAILGISDAMKQGTQEGAEYTAGIASLKGDLNELEATAAAGFLTTFDQGVAAINADMPNLNSQIDYFTQLLGGAAVPAINGVITGLNIANPLFVQGAQYVGQLADGFQRWTEDGGLATFVTQAEQELPQVVDTIGSLANGAVKLIGDLAPVGTVFLNVATGAGELLGDLASLGPVFPAVALGVATAVVGYKAWNGLLTTGQSLYQTVKSGVSSISDAITVNAAAVEDEVFAESEWIALTQEEIAASAEFTELLATQPGVMEAVAAGEDAMATSTAAAGAAFDFATGGIGLIVAGLGALAAVFAVSAASTQMNTTATTDYTQALQADNDAIGQNVEKTAVKALADAGALATAEKYGISLQTVTQAALGNADAQGKYNMALGDVENKLGFYNASGSELSATQQKQQKSLDDLTNSVFGNSSAIQKQLGTNKLEADALNSGTDAAGKQKSAMDLLTTSEDKLTTAQSNATAAAQKYAAFVAAQSDDALKLAQANATLQGDYNNLGQTVTSNLQSMNKAQATSLDVSTATGLANHNMILQGISDSEAQASAVYQSTLEQTGSKQKATDAANAALAANDAALETNATKAGLNQAAVQALINTIVQIPPNPEVTIAVNTAAAEAAIDSFVATTAGKLQFVQTEEAHMPSQGHAQGGIAHLAAGGSPWVAGPGTSTSDSIATMLSNGEYITSASSAAYDPQFMDSYNANPSKTLGAIAAMGASAASSTAPAQFTVIIQPTGGIDLSKYITVSIQQVGSKAFTKVKGGKTI